MKPLLSAALKGFSEGAAAYSDGRPDYPPTMMQWIHEQLHIGAGQIVIDLGAGTGKFTKLLLESGARVIAIEPVEAMRTQFSKVLPGAEVIAGTADATGLQTGSANAIFCAQAFHWFATRDALEEIHRVLVPGGTLGLVWNVRDESVDWVAELTRIITPYEGATPRFHTGSWRQIFKGDLFAERTESIFSYHHIGSPQKVIIDRFMSVSFIASLPSLEKARVTARLQMLIDTYPQLKNRSEITFPYETRTFSFVSI